MALSLINLGFFAIAALFVYGVVRELLRHRRAAIATQQRQAAQANKPNAGQMLAGVDMALEESEKILSEMMAKNPPPTPEQLKPLQVRVNQLKWVQANKWWLEYAAPYADTLMQGFLKMFK